MKRIVASIFGLKNYQKKLVFGFSCIFMVYLWLGVLEQEILPKMKGR